MDVSRDSGLFFSLIQVSLGTRQVLSGIPSKEEWQAMFDTASRQALSGICFCGLSNLYRSENSLVKWYKDGGIASLSKELYFSWANLALQIQDRNATLDSRCVDLQTLLGNMGLRTSILKGQGVATLYGSLSAYRQSGDIDVWAEGGIQTLLPVVYEKFGKCDFDYINAHLKIYDDAEVELHWRVQAFTNFNKNRKLQRWVNENRAELLAGTAELGPGDVVVPSSEFNCFYLLLHAYHHMFESGLGLRQIMDYYFALKREKDAGIRKRVDALIGRFGLRRFASALMWIMAFVFEGKDDPDVAWESECSWMICCPDAREGEYILDEVMRNGNFGHYDVRVKRSRISMLNPIFKRIQHNWHLVRRYPSHMFWAPVWLLWHFFWKRKQIIAL